MVKTYLEATLELEMVETVGNDDGDRDKLYFILFSVED